MNGIICLLLGLTLLYWTAIQPVMKRRSLRIRLERRDALQNAKIKAIRNFYPGLSDLTPQEIREQFDVQRTYDHIASLR